MNDQMVSRESEHATKVQSVGIHTEERPVTSDESRQMAAAQMAAARRVWLIVLIVIVLVGVCAGVGGFAWHRYRNQPVTVLEHGQSYGYSWELYAKTSDGSLCLGIAAPHGRQTMHTFGGDYANTFLQSCNFDNTETSEAESFTMDAPTWREISDESFHGPFIRFAPAPANVVRVRVAQHRVVNTHVLDRPGFPRVTYWYYPINVSGGSQADGEPCGERRDNERHDGLEKGDCLITAYDAQGHPVPFGKDYRQASLPQTVRSWFTR